MVFGLCAFGLVLSLEKAWGGLLVVNRFSVPPRVNSPPLVLLLKLVPVSVVLLVVIGRSSLFCVWLGLRRAPLGLAGRWRYERTGFIT
jgi:hypothetical protein